MAMRIIGSTRTVEVRPRRSPTRQRQWEVGVSGPGEHWSQPAGDQREQPQPVRVQAIRVDHPAALVSHLLDVVRVIQEAERLEVDVGGTTYRRHLQPGGRLVEVRMGRNRVEYAVEVYPTGPAWLDPSDREVVVWW